HMVQTADELHQKYICNHQRAHLDLGHLALDMLQLGYPDLSCTDCYYPHRTSPSLLYSQRTQDAFAVLTNIALTLLQQHTPLFQLPTLPFQYQNTFDYYLDEPQTFSFEESGNFKDTHHFYEPEDNLPPYSEE
ncbi:12294_t:CDS:2, partial [Cetraspora pellucida]